MNPSSSFIQRAGINLNAPIPSIGWSIQIPQSMSERLKGVVVVGKNPMDLMERVSRFFVNNGEPYSEDDFIRELHKQWPKECFKFPYEGEPFSGVRDKGGVTLRHVLQFASHMWQWHRVYGKALISEETAQERFKTCESCPYSKKELQSEDDGILRRLCGSCGVQQAAYAYVKDLVKHAGTVKEGLTSEEISPLYCSDCLCDLRSRVWFPEKKPCWVR